MRLRPSPSPMRFRLRTLMIVLALGPPIVAVSVPPLLKWLAQKPTPALAPAAKPITSGGPYFAAYTTGNTDPVKVENVLKALLGATPVNIQRDEATGQIGVWGVEAAHDTIRAIIREMQNPPQDSI